MNLWTLPTQARLAGEDYPHVTDFREVLPVLRLLGDESRPAWLRWYTALELFYRRRVPPEAEAEALEYLSDFLTCGDRGKPGPRLLDWQLDAAEIVSDVNAVAGREVRSMEYLHWWSFLSFFHGIREGRLSALVTLRDKLRRGQKLDPWEQDYAQRNPDKARLRPPETEADRAHRQYLEQMLK